MAATEKIVVIADPHGRVLAAQLPGGVKTDSDETGPAAALLALEGQRTLTVELPREVLELPAPCLHRFFSEVHIRWPAEVQLPRIEIEKTHKD